MGVRRRRAKIYKRREYSKASKSAQNFFGLLLSGAKKVAKGTGKFISSTARYGSDILKKGGRVAGRKSDTVSKLTTSAGSRIAGNAKLLGVASVAAMAAYQAYEKYKEMEEEEVRCHATCLPKNWLEYKQDPSVTGDDLIYMDETDEGKTYLEDEDADPSYFCNETNCTKNRIMVDHGKRDHCDTYCDKYCDPGSLWDGLAGDAGENAQSLYDKLMANAGKLPIIGPLIEAIEQLIPYIVGFIILIIAFKIFTTLKAAGVFKMFKKKTVD